MPPRVATWLLMNLVSHPKRESLAGDLAEVYAQGRSSTWYWKQVLLAITVGSWKEIWGHKLLALRALVIGQLILVVLRKRLLSPLPGLIYERLLPTGAWEVRIALLLVAEGIVGATAGWVIGRMHRPRGMVMVIACVACYLLEQIVFVSLYWRPYSVNFAANIEATFLPVLGAMIGGLLSVPRLEPTRPDS